MREGGRVLKAEKRTVTEIIRGIILLITVALSISFLIINIYTGMTGLEIPKTDSTDLTSDWKDIYGVSYRLDSLPEGDLVLKKNLKKNLKKSLKKCLTCRLGWYKIRDSFNCEGVPISDAC